MEEIKDVTADSSTAEDVKNTSTEDTATTQVVTGESSEPENLSSQLSEEEIDEKGVSYKNRYFEMKRKLEDSVDSIPKIIESKLQEFNQLKTQEVPKPQEYSISELEEFAKLKPEHKSWVEEEKAKIIAKNAAKEVEKTFQERERARVFEETRKASYAKLQNDYPEFFIKDSQGNVRGWDNSNPTVRDIAVLSQDPRLKNDPEGILLATYIAMGRSAKSSIASQQRELKTVKAKAKDLEKKTFVEGASGKPAQTSKDPVRSAIDQAKNTGNKRDINAAISAYFSKAHLGDR